MRATRRAQPYRKGQSTRAPGGALAAMMRGRGAQGQNQADVTRALQKQARRKPPGKLARKMRRL